MTTRDKLIRIIQNAVDGCAEYWAGVIADELIKSGLVVDDRVYEPIKKKEEDGKLFAFHCQKCDQLLYYGCETTINRLKYCKNCGCKLKE